MVRIMSTMVKVGLLTIGQSPRVDILGDWGFDPEKLVNYKPMEIITPPSRSIIPGNIELLHIGALDYIPSEKIHEIQPGPGKRGPISRLKDGSWTLIDEEKLRSLMIDCVERLEKAECRAILQLCTGNFPYLKPKVTYLKAGALCRSLIESVLGLDRRLGIFMPHPLKPGHEKQLKPIKSPNWGEREIYSVNANPYQPPADSIKPAVLDMLEQDVDMAYMGCLGYSIEHKRIAAEILNRPVILPRTVAGRAIAELFGE